MSGDLERQLRKHAEELIAERARELTRAFDRIRRNAQGKTADEIAEEIRAAARRINQDIDAESVRNYAEALAAGRRVEFKGKVVG